MLLESYLTVGESYLGIGKCVLESYCNGRRIVCVWVRARVDVLYLKLFT